MANLQVKNLPEELNERLRAHARAQQRTIRDVVLEAVRRELDRHAFVDRLSQREPARLRTSPAQLLEEARRDRAAER